MLPGGKHQQATCRTGVELLAVGLRELGEAVLQQDDGGKACVKGGAHHALLAGRDGWGDEDGTLAGLCQVSGGGFVYLLVGEAARELHGDAPRGGEQASVADAVEGEGAELEAEEGVKPVGTGVLHQEATRVVEEVVLPDGQLVVGAKDQVVVAAGEEGALGKRRGGREEVKAAREAAEPLLAEKGGTPGPRRASP